ncbi:myo-inositol 2-dehydrogenase/D-chiro-inositol 1-dehydrogenase [Geomicrobium halophilum]|uniref:Myo-inositol 2-dehydrogenase/D-chiro-inositol 1-dehydrogenase n=1 Tax=Geomicrobium halophilum TaxID=549000 RepID=A0A841PIY6_9BACL|nr:Gfo/Idh/MocA family oxidoreductase [Geomicrobium halophilum]MBB6448760.1 myo-inositol 2-dehydrogenase/D-chiro-inositol 1-dehydrogenase [Geomicrobium halophilum]
MSKVHVGILGAGFAASLHLEILNQDKRVEIIGIADIFTEKAEALAKSINKNVKVVSSLEELLKLGVDTVYVTTPNTMHAEPVLKCLGHNVNVFSEKPMATYLEEAEQILEATRNSKATYNLGMNRRFAYTHKKIKSLIDEGRMEPYMAHVKLNRGELLHPSWTADPTKTGGFLYETTIHQLDLLTYFFGPIKTLKCEARQNISEIEFDDFAILFTFESGMIATFVSSAHSGWCFPFESVEVYGKYSTAVTEELDTIKFSPGLEKHIELENYTQVPFNKKGGYVEEDELFIDALVNGTNPPVSAEEAYRLTHLITSIYESAKIGKEINFSNALNIKNT